MIRPVEAGDAGRIAEIYNYYIENTVITFEEEPVSTAEISRRISTVTAGYPWIVYEQDGTVTGYAYASRWKERSAYRFCAEVTVYIAHDFCSKGAGTRLMEELLSGLRQTDLRFVISCIAVPNEASSALHRKFGFETTGFFPGVGYKFGKWIDIEYRMLKLK